MAYPGNLKYQERSSTFLAHEGFAFGLETDRRTVHQSNPGKQG